ncbi:MAG: hypothetical protein J6V09_06450 [Clostridia bacterium]|nr:hypothetical protein [Clostridia bacterium]
MKLHEYKPGTAVEGDGYVIALGFFDGVHAAHRMLIATAKKIADEAGLPLAVFTFRAEDTRLKSGIRIYGTEQKLEIFKSLGVDLTVLADFGSVSELSAEDFVSYSLLGDMKCRVAVAGFDYRFGKGAMGDANLLHRMLTEAGAEFVIEDEHKIDNEKISTTKIKELLEGGKVEEAGRYLGMPYFTRTTVTHGIGLGKKLGFPTFNGDGTPSLARGVYRTAVTIAGKLYHAITNVGTCPTFGEREVHDETFVIDFEGDLYGQTVYTYYLGYLREEKAFSDSNELILQIKVDKNRAIKENGDLKWLEIGLNLQ